MHCFNHPDKPAVGVCKACGKGLCHDCAATSPNGLACRNECEKKVLLRNGIYCKNELFDTFLDAQAHTIGLGLILIVISAWNFVIYDNDDLLFNDDLVFLPIIGVLLILYGIIRLAIRSNVPSLTNAQIRALVNGTILIVCGGVPFFCYNNDKFLVLLAIGILFIMDAIFRQRKRPPYSSSEETESNF